MAAMVDIIGSIGSDNDFVMNRWIVIPEPMMA